MELVAVILILGIVALISIPIVTNIITEAKKGAFKSSVQNLMKAVETQCKIEQMKGENITSKYTLTDGKTDNELDVKGDLPTSGTINIDSSCNFDVSVKDENFCAVKDLDNNNLRIGEIKNGVCDV